MQVSQSGRPQNISATAALTTSPVHLVGFYVNSTSSGTLVIRTAGASGTAISGTITPAVGFHCFPAFCSAGIHATITNTLDVTFFYNHD